MKLPKPLALAATSLLAVSALAGCSAGGSEDGPVTLTFQAFANTPEGQTIHQDIVDAWNEEHPETQIELVLTPIDSIYERLSTQAAGGTLPDIFMDDVQDIRQYVEEGFVADLDGLLAEETVDSIDEGVLEAVQIDDTFAGIPTGMQTYAVFANRALIEAAGQTVPTGDSLSWDDFQALAEATTTDSTSGIVWGLKSPTAAFLSLGLGFDAAYFSGEGSDATFELGDAEMEIPNRVSEMITDGSIDPTGASLSSAEVLPTFYSGGAAMIVQQSYHIANIASDAPEGLDWVVLPPLAGSESAEQAAIPQTISISSESEHQEQAAAFLDYFMGADNLASLNYAEGFVPPTEESREAVAALANGANGWAEILQSGENLVPMPASAATAYPSWKSTVANPAFQQFLSGQIDEAALESQLTDGWDQTNR